MISLNINIYQIGKIFGTTCREGHLDVVIWLLETFPIDHSETLPSEGKEILIYSGFNEALSSNHSDILKYLYQNYSFSVQKIRKTALRDVIKNNGIESLDYILKNVPKTNKGFEFYFKLILEQGDISNGKYARYLTLRDKSDKLCILSIDMLKYLLTNTACGRLSIEHYYHLYVAYAENLEEAFENMLELYSEIIDDISLCARDSYLSETIELIVIFNNIELLPVLVELPFRFRSVVKFNLNSELSSKIKSIIKEIYQNALKYDNLEIIRWLVENHIDKIFPAPLTKYDDYLSSESYLYLLENNLIDQSSINLDLEVNNRNRNGKHIPLKLLNNPPLDWFYYEDQDIIPIEFYNSWQEYWLHKIKNDFGDNRKIPAQLWLNLMSDKTESHKWWYQRFEDELKYQPESEEYLKVEKKFEDQKESEIYSYIKLLFQ